VRAEIPTRSAYTLFLDSLREYEGANMPEKALVLRAAALWQSFSPAERIPFQNEGNCCALLLFIFLIYFCSQARAS
jgi:hypothetical protein